MSTAERKAVIKHADMNEEMQQDAIDCANVALEKFNIEKDIAAYIKKEFDKKYNPTWHCVVGRNFGSYVTHETKHFIYFYMGQVAVLLFKSGWTWSSIPSNISHFYTKTWHLHVITSNNLKKSAYMQSLWFCLGSNVIVFEWAVASLHNKSKQIPAYFMWLNNWDKDQALTSCCFFFSFFCSDLSIDN